MLDNDTLKGMTVLLIVIVLIFSVLTGLYLISINTSESYTLTINSFHNNVEFYLYNPLLIGQSTINKGTTSLTLPGGNYTIKAELFRAYSEPVIWTKSFTLDRDMEVKLFED